jgi:hypothetical protein
MGSNTRPRIFIETTPYLAQCEDRQCEVCYLIKVTPLIGAVFSEIGDQAFKNTLEKNLPQFRGKLAKILQTFEDDVRWEINDFTSKGTEES